MYRLTDALTSGDSHRKSMRMEFRYTHGVDRRYFHGRVFEFGKLPNRNYARQFGSHLGRAGLSVPLLGNCDAADAATPAGVASGRYLAMTVGSIFAIALSGRRAQTSSIPKSGIPR